MTKQEAKKMDACKSCKKEDTRPLSLLIEEEPTKKVRDYQWATTMKSTNLFTLTGDVEEMSVYAAGEQLFKSHIFSALGAVLYEGRSICVWIDYPMQIIQKFGKKHETKRCYPNTPLKQRNYFCIEYEAELFGLSPSCQEFRIINQASLSQFGLKLQEKHFSFQEDDWLTAIKCVEIDIDQVTEEPTMTRLKEWLEMTTEEENAVDQLRMNLKKKQAAMNDDE